jgi:radical SAM superfamily enzyme YgiQ (UPF0313 family)
MNFLLVEPISKTPYPPLGLMRISSMLKLKFPNCCVKYLFGNNELDRLFYPDIIYVTTLFTWQSYEVIKLVRTLQHIYKGSEIQIGGIAASLMPTLFETALGVKPVVGLLSEAEQYAPDYTANFGRKLNTSISYTTRGCNRHCRFCVVDKLEPKFIYRDNWVNDINPKLSQITFWDNNWLYNNELEKDVQILKKLNKRIDFNQGLDARLFDEEKAKLLSVLNINPIRFAFDDIRETTNVMHAIKLAKKYFKDIRVYVLYNYADTPDDFFERINLLNKAEVFAFPMMYRPNNESVRTLPNKHWDTKLLRALKLSLLFYYSKGMITKKRDSFVTIYGDNPSEFKMKLYKIYEYDKIINRKKTG